MRIIRDQDIKAFLYKNIITRFGIPRTIVMDNGAQFKSSDVRDLCYKYGIKQSFLSPTYPQGNRHAEASNKIILDGLKKRLDEVKNKWVEELPTVFWAYRTSTRISTRDPLLHDLWNRGNHTTGGRHAFTKDGPSGFRGK